MNNIQYVTYVYKSEIFIYFLYAHRHNLSLILKINSRKLVNNSSLFSRGKFHVFDCIEPKLIK